MKLLTLFLASTSLTAANQQRAVVTVTSYLPFEQHPCYGYFMLGGDGNLPTEARQSCQLGACCIGIKDIATNTNNGGNIVGGNVDPNGHPVTTARPQSSRGSSQPSTTASQRPSGDSCNGMTSSVITIVTPSSGTSKLITGSSVIKSVSTSASVTRALDETITNNHAITEGVTTASIKTLPKTSHETEVTNTTPQIVTLITTSATKPVIKTTTSEILTTQTTTTNVIITTTETLTTPKVITPTKAITISNSTTTTSIKTLPKTSHETEVTTTTPRVVTFITTSTTKPIIETTTTNIITTTTETLTTPKVITPTKAITISNSTTTTSIKTLPKTSHETKVTTTTPQVVTFITTSTTKPIIKTTTTNIITTTTETLTTPKVITPTKAITTSNATTTSSITTMSKKTPTRIVPIVTTTTTIPEVVNSTMSSSSLTPLTSTLTATLTTFTPAIVSSLIPPPPDPKTERKVPKSCPTPTCAHGIQYALYDNPFRNDMSPTYKSFSPAVFKKTTPRYSTTLQSAIFISDHGNGGAFNPLFVNAAAGYRGFLFTCQAGRYRFNSPHSDDITIMWFGAKAYEGYTRENADVVQTFYGDNKPKDIYRDLAAGTYYPIRVLWGNTGHAADLSLRIYGPDGQDISGADLKGEYYLTTEACDGSYAPFPPWGQEK